MNEYKLLIVFWDNYPQSTINQFYKSLEYYKKLVPENSKLTILDLTSFSLAKIKNNYIHKDEKVEYLKPNNFDHLRKIKFNFRNYKKVYALGPVYSDFKSILIFLILRWLNIKIIFINYFGYYLKEKNVINFNIVYKLKRFFLLKLSYYFSRILSQISIFPKIDYYFETSQERIDQMKNTFFQKILNKSSIFNSSNSQKIFRINSIYYDQQKIKNYKILGEDYIVFLDSGFDHPDRLKEGKIKDQTKHDFKRKKYYENLYKFMLNLERLYKQKIVFCQHPKTDYASNKYFQIIENQFQVTRGKSEEYLEKGELIVFTGASSMVNKAIISKKKILYALSGSLGSHIRDKVLSFINTIKLPIINLDQFDSLNKETIDIQIMRSLKLYDNFIQKNHISEKNLLSHEQIKKVLYEVSKS